ncbi:hypothetical protein EV702DRAFT_1065856 [Suillus placidus]|uniref:Uncharacterized protein n=1 Tax=Suillus placidus TaxID=48579 RepID=A0A9P7D864_9AGAM|nr:hypothetical protein EV702DRAFT_1065856 [Suillus placidus]
MSSWAVCPSNIRKPAIPERITIIFQGGFVGPKCRIEVSSESSNRSEWQGMDSEDANRRQIFDLITHRDGLPGEGIQSMKLVFEESAEFPV